jgi:predicted DCC family thiol-disulfide oxidoreductase YuxK
MTPALTLYFDGRCPFCVRGMVRLRRWDAAGRLAFADIAAPGFDPAVLGVDMAALDRALHGRADNGAILVGIDCMLAAYTLAGQGWRVLPLRVRLLRPVLARAYRWFARHRYQISEGLGLRLPAASDGDTCAVGNPFLKAHPTRSKAP